MKFRSGLFRLLVAGLLVAGAAAARAQSAPTDPALSPGQSRAVEQIVHDYLLQHPEVIIAAMQAAKDKEQQESEDRARAAIKARRSELLDDPASPTAGNAHGDVTIVEFFDYRCPYCKRVQPSLDALLREDPKLRIVYKEFPILGPPSVFAARVALAARKQGKYDVFHKAMMATVGEDEITDQVVLGVARSAGLDLDKLKTDIQAPDIDATIRHDYELADELEITGTPGIVIGDAIADGGASVDSLRQMIADARKAQ